MSVMIYDTANSAFKEAETPNIFSPTDNAWKDTTGKVYNHTEQTWEEKWSQLKKVTFADGTDEEISAMVQAHYDGKINISDYWAVGDTRSVSLSAMSATGVSESHVAQTVKFAIADFEHDYLTNSINGHTKAAVTLTQVSPLKNNSIIEAGYMENSYTSIIGWIKCKRRAWCNNVYYNAFPVEFKNLIKEVNKLSVSGPEDSLVINTTIDKAFLMSKVEVFGINFRKEKEEGTQYEYYKTPGNRKKNNVFWWGRSSHDASFFNVKPDGTTDESRKDRTEYEGTPYGIVPNICL